MGTDFNWSPAISERARGTWFRHLTLQIFNQLWGTNTKGYEKGKGKGSTANWPLSGRNEFGYGNEGGKLHQDSQQQRNSQGRIVPN